MRISFARAPISPDLERPVYLAGFSRNRKAQALDHELEVCALSLEDGDRLLVLVAVDVIGLFQPDVAEVVSTVQQRSTRPIEVLIASTHTHHAPDTLGLWGPNEMQSGVDPVYMTWLKATIADTIGAAAAGPHHEVGRCVSASVAVPGLVKNTRDPELIDDELVVLRLQDADGQDLAILCDYPCHPEVLTDTATTLTADYAGYLRRAVESMTGAPCIFFAGALGGMLTPATDDRTLEGCRHMGEALAAAAVRATGVENRDRVVEPGCSFRFKRGRVSIPLRNKLFEMAFALGILPDTRDSAGDLQVPVSLLQIGSLWMAGVPGEMLPGLGLRLKEELRAAGARTAGIIGLADDEIGYILPADDYITPDDWTNPGEQYEESMSLGPEAGPAVMQGARSLLQ